MPCFYHSEKKTSLTLILPVILTFVWTVFELRDCNIFSLDRQGNFRYRQGQLWYTKRWASDSSC